jgi:RNA polymerase sporulation-specific sigma factor
MSNIENKSDDELLLLSKDNNSDATEELIIRYRKTVETIVQRYIGSPLERDDLIQEGLIGLLAAIQSYKTDKGTKFVTYASRCINNSIQSALKKFNRMKDVPPSNIVEFEDEAFGTQYSLSAEDEYLAKESVSTLTDILYEGLSSFENEVLRLYIVGYSYNEIAEKLGKNAKAIDNAIQRIRKKLAGVAL